MSIPLGEVLLRLGAAFVTGFILGLERERHGRPAGLRTTILVCVAGAVGMMLSMFWSVDSVAVDTTVLRLDPGRLAAGLLTGMGFLGAGTILRQGNTVRGVTTAAMLWYATILGLVYGSGYYLLGVVGLLIALVIVFIMPWFDARVNVEHYATLLIQLGMDGAPNEELSRLVRSHGARILKLDLDYDLKSKQRTLRYELEFRQRQADEITQKLTPSLLQLPGVAHVAWS